MMNRNFSRWFFNQILNWKMIGTFPTLPKYIVAVVPHTSWVDLILGVIVRNISGESINFVGKKELFGPLTGWFFRALGGTPVDRSKSNNLVDAIVQIFNSKSEFILGLSPEGTRKKVEKWKTGFYFIAKGAKVPIVMATLDFENKKIKISEPYYPTDDKEKDFKFFYSFYENVKGKNLNCHKQFSYFI